MRNFWDEIQEATANHEEKQKAPLIDLNLDKPQANLEIQSRYKWLSLPIQAQAKLLP